MNNIQQWLMPPSCLDAAYERLAIEQGLISHPVFPENSYENYLGESEQIKRNLSWSRDK